MNRRTRGAAALVAVGLFALLATPTTVDAKDQEAAGPDRVYTIQLPKRWRTGAVPDEPGALGLYEGWFGLPTDEPELTLLVRHATAFSRADLAHDMLHGLFGRPVEGTLTRHPDRVASCRVIGDDGTAVWRAFVQHDGVVMYAETGLHESAFETYGKWLGDIVSSLAVHAAPKKDSARLDWVQRDEGPFEVWTKPRAGKAVDKAVEELREGWKAASDLLGELPLQSGPAIVIAHTDDADYDAAQRGQNLSTVTFADVFDGYLHVRLGGVKGKAYQDILRSQGARMRIRHHFGGPCPRWLEDGLATYVQVALASGKASKPKSVHINKARPYVAETTATWLQEMGAAWTLADDAPRVRHTLWAWHWYFRHGPGLDEHGERYEKSIAQLRKTGEMAASAAAWDGVDQNALLADFKAWAKKW